MSEIQIITLFNAAKVINAMIEKNGDDHKKVEANQLYNERRNNRLGVECWKDENEKWVINLTDVKVLYNKYTKKSKHSGRGVDASAIADQLLA